MGVRVGIIAAPDINSSDDFTRLGEPRWFFGVTAGNLDSMLMYMTAAKKRRRNDEYVPKGFPVVRPKRAVIAYCNKLRGLFTHPQILVGGIEASLRRFAHYDYWENKVRRSILFDARADILVYGMAEKPLQKIVQSVRAGTGLSMIRGISGTAVIVSEKEGGRMRKSTLVISSFEEVRSSKNKYTAASKAIHQNQNPYHAKTLLQKHGNRYPVYIHLLQL